MKKALLFTVIFIFSIIFSTVVFAIPQFSSLLESTANNSAYASGATYRFNITWTNSTTNETMANVTFKTNLTGSNVTYNGSSSPAVVNITGGTPVGFANYSITFTDLAAGNYFYEWTAFNNASQSNTTTRIYVIAKAALNLNLSVTSPTYPTNTVATANETNNGDSDVNYTLYLNTSGIVNSSSSLGNGNISQSILLGGGGYLYTYNTTAGAFVNYTANTTGITSTATVSANSSTANFINLTINGTEANQTFIYPNVSNTTGNISSAVFGNQVITFTLYRNATTIGTVVGGTNTSASDTGQLGGGVHVYVFNTSGNANYSSASKVFNLTISNQTNIINVYLNGTQNSNKTYTYPQSINVTGTGTGNVTIFINGTTLVANGTSSASYLVLLGNGTNNFTVNASGDANTSANSTGLTFFAFVNKGTPTISIAGTNAVTEPTATNATCSVTSYNPNNEATITLYRGSNTIGSGTFVSDYQNFLGAGSYGYVCNNSASASANWTNTTQSATLIVNAAPTSSGSGSVTTTTTGNILVGTINAGATTNITITDISQAFREIDITVINKVSAVAMKITKYTTQPATVTTPPTTNTLYIYQYLDIFKANIEDTDMRTVTLKFAVPKTWLANLDPLSIVLKRYVNGVWAALPTSKTSETSTEVVYTSTSPGLSVFAIVSEPVTAPPPSTTSNETVANVTSNITSTTTQTGQPGDLSPLLGYLLPIGIAILVIAGIAVYFFVIRPKVGAGEVKPQKQGPSALSNFKNKVSGIFKRKKKEKTPSKKEIKSSKSQQTKYVYKQPS